MLLYRVESFFWCERSEKIMLKKVCVFVRLTLYYRLGSQATITALRNLQQFWDQGSKIFGQKPGSVLKKYTLLTPWLLCRIETLFQTSRSLVDKPFVAAVATTINQGQYASSYIVISSNTKPFLKHVRLMCINEFLAN